MIRLIPLVISFVVAVSVHAATVTVDDDGSADFDTLQAALDAATTGDVVLVADGIYTGPGNRGLEFDGKNITLRSENGPATCIIDCRRQDRAFYVHDEEGPSCLIEGFTIINGSASNGGAIYCYRASPTIRDCIFTDNGASSYGGAIACRYGRPMIDHCVVRNNAAGDGGGIYCEYDAEPTIVACTIIGNRAEWTAGGIDCAYDSAVTIVNCVLAANSSGRDGGAVCVGNVSPIITNCTIASNTADNDGGGIFCEYGSSPRITNCLFHGNLNHAIYEDSTSAEPEVSFCLFADNTVADYYDADERESYTGAAQLNALSGLTNNLSGDPAFAFTDDFHLMAGSAGIDSGTNNVPGTLAALDIEGRTRVIGGTGSSAATIDIGAYEYDPDRPAIALSPAFFEFVREVDGPEPQGQVLKIRNAAAGRLDWRLETPCPWLTAAPPAGVSTGPANEITLSVDASQLSGGLYQCAVNITDPSASNDSRGVIVTLRVKGTLYVPQQFPTIQGAVNAAMSGETIVVSQGLYQEYVTVDRQLTLLGLDSPTIDRATSYVLRLSAADCTVEGFVITGGTVGIAVESAGNTIRNNTIVGNQRGVELRYNSDRNTLTDNEIQDNTLEGVSIDRAARNTLKDNHISGSAVGFAVSGSSLADYSQDIDISNTVDGKPIYYLLGETDVVVDSSSDAACVFAISCSGITVKDLTLSGNGRGVCFVSTDNSVIENVMAPGNEEAGIWLEGSSHNTLTGNTASNSHYGIVLFGSGGNTLTANTCSGSDYNFFCRGSTTPHYLQDIDLSNTAEGQPIYYLVGETGATVDATTDAACVYAVDCRDVTVRDLSFGGNGTGVAFVGTSESQIVNVTCLGNLEAGILLRNCTDICVKGCESTRNGAGIAVYGGSDIRIGRTSAVSNTAGVKFVGSEQIKAVNSIVKNNSRQAGPADAAAETWGGILAQACRGLSLTNCTVYGNAGSYYIGYQGGGIVCDSSSTATVVNSIVWANRPLQIEASYYGGRGGPVSSSVTVAHCDVQGGFLGLENIDEAPLIAGDGHLQMNSPCIDRGDSNVSTLPQIDMDSETRLSGLAVDLGADEYIDEDRDGLPNWWEAVFFGSDIAAPEDDPDSDGHKNLDEYRWYGSDPTVPSNTYYVNAGQGDNANDGRSPDLALKSIQAAIQAAENSDTVLVAPGAYGETLSLLGRQIILQSTDPADRDVVASTLVSGPVYFTTGELPGCVMDGLTVSPVGSLTPAYYYDETGIICSGSSPTIRRCVLTGLAQYYGVDLGAAISCLDADPAILQCTISGNWVEQQGTVIRMDGSDVVMRNCLVCGNGSQYAYGEGQVLNLTNSRLRMSNCTLAQNGLAEQYVSGGSTLYCAGSELLITNSIFWNETYREINGGSTSTRGGTSSLPSSTVKVMYSNMRLRPEYNIPWPWPGQGNVSVDPCFVRLGYWPQDPRYYPYNFGTWVDGDYHLKSQGWRYSASLSHGSHWVWDDETSLCIDTGSPGSPLEAELLAVPNDPANENGRNIRINMGAYGATAEASMAPPGWALLPDLSNDGTVDLCDRDLWTENAAQPEAESPADLDRDGDVDQADLDRLEQDWQAQTTWFGTMTLLPPETVPQTPGGGR